MNIQINKNSLTPIYKQIKNIIKEKIVTGELAPGFRLPSERKLSQTLQIHRNTVVKAYEELIEDGLIFPSRKKPMGYFVGSENDQEEIINQLTQNGYSPLNRVVKPDFLHSYNQFNKIYIDSYKEKQINMAGMLLNDEVTPVSSIKKIMEEIRKDDSLLPFSYCEPQGAYALRKSIVNMLDKRNISVMPQNIQILSETYQAINLIVETYMKKGEVVLVEEPISADITGVFTNAGAKVVTVPRTRDGIDIPLLEKVILRHHPKLIYTMPDGQNPTGSVLSLENRKALIACANKYSIPILEEGYLAEFNYDDKRIPSLFALDYSNSVIYLDTSQLSFYLGARIAYMAAPENVIESCRQIVEKDQFFINTLSQYMWSRYIDEGYYDKQLAFLKDYYRKKRDLLCGELSKISEISFEKPETGLLVWCRLPNNIDENQLFYRAKKQGLLFMPGYLFFPYGNQGETHLRLSFSGISDEEIVDGVKILKQVIDSCKK